jgi:hypothetical protein
MRDDVTNLNCDACWMRVSPGNELQIASLFNFRHTLSISEYLGNFSRLLTPQPASKASPALPQPLSPQKPIAIRIRACLSLRWITCRASQP